MSANLEGVAGRPGALHPVDKRARNVTDRSVHAVPMGHLAYAKHQKLHFPLLSDFEPKGDVARAYGVYHTPSGTSERALFVLDEAGTIRWSYVSPIGVNPGADGILGALEAMDGTRAS